MRLVVDTGPLIALSKTGHLDLLPDLFDDIVIPAAVLGEIRETWRDALRLRNRDPSPVRNARCRRRCASRAPEIF